jgi:hypothetical protein
MSFYDFCKWLSETAFSHALREQPYPYPVLLIIHVISIALFGGAVAMGNLRVLGIAMKNVPVSQVIGQLRAWKWIGFAFLLVTGTFLAISDPMEYYDNPMFWISFGLLIIAAVNAAIFRYGIYRSVAAWDEGTDAPAGARRWATVSLVLWIALVFAGRGIAFF